jgi:hypothetical protein
MWRTAAIRLSDAEVLGSRLQFPGFYPKGTAHHTSFNLFSFFSALDFPFFPTLFPLLFSFILPFFIS